MQSVSSRIWTRVAVSIFNDANHYTTDIYICVWGVIFMPNYWVTDKESSTVYSYPLHLLLLDIQGHLKVIREIKGQSWNRTQLGIIQVGKWFTNRVLTFNEILINSLVLNFLYLFFFHFTEKIMKKNLSNWQILKKKRMPGNICSFQPCVFYFDDLPIRKKFYLAFFFFCFPKKHRK